MIPKKSFLFFFINKASLLKNNFKKNCVVPTSHSQINGAPTVLYTEDFSFVLEVKSLAVLCTADRWRFVHEAVLYLDGTIDDG